MAGAELAMLLTLKDDSGPAFKAAEDKVSSFGERVGNIGSTVATVFGGAALAGVGALAAGFGVGLAGASDLESATAKLKGQLGLTSEEAQTLGGVVEDVFRSNFGESREAVASAVSSIQQNIGKISPDATRAAAESALALESLFDAPVAESSRAVGVMMKNFEGLSETQAYDLIAAGFQRGGNYADDLLDTLTEYAPQFAKLGINAEQAMGTLIAGSQAGAFNMDKVGDAVKEFSIRAQDGSTLTADGFKAIGLNADEMSAAIAKGGPAAEQAYAATLAALAAMEDPLARNQAGVALFGTQWEDLGPTVVAAMAQGLQGVEGYEGAAARAAATTGEGFAAAVEGLKRSFTGLLVDAVMPLMPGITSLVNALATALPEAFAAVKSAIDPFLPLVAQAGEALVSMGQSAPEMAATISQAFDGLVAVVGPAVQEIAGFIMEQFGVVVDWVRENWPLIQQTIQTVLAAISALWNEYGDEIMTVVRALWEIIKTVVDTGMRNLLDTIKLSMQLINGDWSGAWETLQGMVSRTLDAIGTILSSAFDIWYTLMDVQTGGMLTRVSQWMRDTQTAISDGMTAVEKAINDAWEAVGRAIDNILPTIASSIMAVWNAIPEDIRADLVKIADHIVTQGAIWVTNLTTAGSNMLTAITSALTSMVTAVTTWASSTFLAPITGLATSTSTAMTTAGSGMLTAITGKLGEIVGAVTTWASSTFLAPLQNLINTARTTASNIGQAIVDGVRNAISAGAGAIRSAIESAVRGALDAAKAALGISSPSRVFRDEVGLPIAQGLAGGIVAGMSLVGDATRQILVPVLAFTDAATTAVSRQAGLMLQLAERAAFEAADALARSRLPNIGQLTGALGQTIGQGVNLIRQFEQLASGSIIPGQTGGGSQYGLIPIGPGTIQQSSLGDRALGSGAVQQHEHRVRIGDSEAMRIVVVGRELESRVYGSNA